MTYAFSYVMNTNPTYTVDYNHWKMLSILTRPDGAEERTYTNHIAAVMLHELKNPVTGDKWIDFSLFDSDTGYRIRHATPAALHSYDDTHNDLGISLNAHGLIERTEHYTSAGAGRILNSTIKANSSRAASISTSPHAESAARPRTTTKRVSVLIR